MLHSRTATLGPAVPVMAQTRPVNAGPESSFCGVVLASETCRTVRTGDAVFCVCLELPGPTAAGDSRQANSRRPGYFRRATWQARRPLFCSVLLHHFHSRRVAGGSDEQGARAGMGMRDLERGDRCVWAFAHLSATGVGKNVCGRR